MLKNALTLLFNDMYFYHQYCIHPLNYVVICLLKYVNLVDIGEILPTAPQIVVKTSFNTHF